MTLSLVTGHTGAEHVTAAQAGLVNAGVTGTGCYVFDLLGKFACTVESANSLTIGTGVARINGRDVVSDAATSLSIANGVSGQNRRDLVVARYSLDSSTGVESATLAVIKGTATTGTPSDPAYSSGSVIDGKSTVDFPLWRVPVNGVNVGTPVRLFSTVPTMAGLADKVASAESDTGVVTIYKTSDDSGSWEVRARRVGAVVEIWLEDYGFYGIQTDSDGSPTYRTLYPTIPAQFRPKYAVQDHGSVLSNTIANANWRITSDGLIKLWASNTDIRYFVCHMVYLGA